MADAELKQRITTAMKDAMRAKDKPRLGVIRLILAEFKRIEVDERIDLDEPRILAVLDKMAKQRRDSARQYTDAGRTDLAEQEDFEIGVIQEFLPAALGDAELNTIIAAAITDSGATSARDMGKVMGLVKPQVQGRADMGAVSRIVKEQLAAQA
ncbi:GatB/YqeY domain-containing protein [Exilibacterium tricleocarpae]|uniref:GatB/YqeY domain-containing protein n=1 Tax=Exilibacterium tricleocarpae TaxID=2591008 RepID=A0A545T3L6_9GAMM|nr:GatB/YqeY domain-containing protein [Exilibacterium tricleocarpae]TQV71802.1 GatB/YqeY domain-containing protein [Exilibacterium tricleocarpae]